MFSLATSFNCSFCGDPRSSLDIEFCANSDMVAFVSCWMDCLSLRGLSFEPTQVVPRWPEARTTNNLSHLLNTSLHSLHFDVESSNQGDGTCTWSLIFILRIHLFAGETCKKSPMLISSHNKYACPCCMQLKNHIYHITYWKLLKSLTLAS